MLAELLDEVAPSVAVLDGIAALAHEPSGPEVTSIVAREIDLLKTRGITAMVTTLAHEEETSTLNVSSLVDTWLLLRNVESNGERNRLLFVVKSRGSAHSNQVREFVLTDHGVELVDVYVGPAGIATGSERVVQEAEQREVAQQQHEELLRRQREVRRRIVEREAQLAVLQEELEFERAELERIDVSEQRHTSASEADQSAMAARRWADSAPRGE
jgi:circadian clock protein KaiC